MKSGSRIVALPKPVQERWTGLRAALDLAAAPFTGKSTFSVSIFYLHDVIGAEEAMSRALDDVRKSVPDIPLYGEFTLTESGPAIKVSWQAASAAAARELGRGQETVRAAYEEMGEE
jgi:hypothetical protein